MAGKIIVIEGTDCSGKETQSKLLEERLNEKGMKCVKFNFPMYNTPTGKIVGGSYLGRKEIGESLFREYTILNFIGRLGVCIIMPNILIIIFSFKTKEFKYILNIVKPILNKVKYGILNKLHPQIE